MPSDITADTRHRLRIENASDQLCATPVSATSAKKMTNGSTTRTGPAPRGRDTSGALIAAAC